MGLAARERIGVDAPDSIGRIGVEPIAADRIGTHGIGRTG